MISMFNLDGRVAIVTGGNGGIGLGMAEGLAQAGAKIVLVGRNSEKNAASVSRLEKLGVEVFSIEKDLTEATAGAEIASATEERFGRIDILINNAGSNIRKRPEALEPEEFRWVLETNLTSAFLCSQAVYPAMKQVGAGKIINIGSSDELSIKELCLLLKKVINYEGDFQFDSSKPDGTLRKKTDLSKINALGWKAKTNLEEGLSKTYKWFVNNYG